MPPDDALLAVRGLKKHFPIRRGILQRVIGHVRAVDGVDLDVRRGETLGLVGESGCGKTTTGRAILRLVEPTAGEVLFRSRTLAERGERGMVDVAAAAPATLKLVRRDAQIVFQDPWSSLDPRMTVAAIVGEPLRVQGLADARARAARAAELLRAVGLSPDHLRRYPHEFSGGQRQRIGLARALALNPQLVIADEPVSALDVSIQAQVINLMRDLQDAFGLTYLFIAHDLSVVRHISTRVAVMYLGRIVEIAGADALFERPRHPYTEALMSAVPVPDPDFRVERILLAGDVPSPAAPPAGCAFHPRCRYATAQCRAELPLLRELEPGHAASCHRAEELSLRPVRTG